MHKNWKSILVTYGQLDQANIQKWHTENLLIFLKDTFSLCPPKQEWKSGQDLIICQITCRVSPHRCKSSHSHHRLLICCRLSALLCTIISAYHCSCFLAYSTHFACWITGAASILSWYLQSLSVRAISSHELITVSHILSRFDVV